MERTSVCKNVARVWYGVVAVSLEMPEFEDTF